MESRKNKMSERNIKELIERFKSQSDDEIVESMLASCVDNCSCDTTEHCSNCQGYALADRFTKQQNKLTALTNGIGEISEAIEDVRSDLNYGEKNQTDMPRVYMGRAVVILKEQLTKITKLMEGI